VRPRETLFAIALKYNIAPCLLLRLNKLRRSQDIRPGMRLIVPYRGMGDGESFSLDIEDSGPDYFDFSDRGCKLGNDIVASEASRNTATPQIPSGEYFIGDNMKMERYVVKPGDTAYSIAKKFNTTLYNVIIANGLRPPYIIFPGQELTIPYTDEEIAIYTVRPGDTVYKIAMQYGVPISNIVEYNFLDSLATIYPGQELIIKLHS